MKLNSGAKVKHYEIRSLLGKGGMGEVYLAHDTRLERDVAIKFLTATNDREKLARFRREAKVISQLNHPNIVTVFEFGQHENNHFIVTELIRGKVLRRKSSDQPRSVDEILEIGIQIGNALAAAHENNIIHRDIKPENIMILPDGYIKVLDFGLAKLSGADSPVNVNENDVTNTLIQTRSGTILGTVSYMSPEQLRGKDVDERTDIWSLGVILYEMLVNHRPFEGDSVSDIIASVLHQTLPPIHEIMPQISSEISAIIQKCLAKDKNERYTSARELTADLKNAKMHSLSNSGAVIVPVPAKNETLLTKVHSPQTTVEHTEEKNSAWKIPAVLALVLIALGGGYFLYRTFSQAPATVREMKPRRLQTSGNVKNAIISPDGEYIVYAQRDNGQESLWLRQTDESGGTNLIAPAAVNYSGLTFSPDGKSIYFTVFENSSSGILYRMSTLGKARQQIAENLDSPVTFSPDGKEFAFIRSMPSGAIDRIIIANADGSNQRVLLEKKRPEFLFSTSAKEGLAWSPDGQTIAAPLGKTDADGDSMTIVEINVGNGQVKDITTQKWFRVGRIAYTNDAKELIFTAAEIGSVLYQVFKVSRSDGKVLSLRKDFSDYLSLSITNNADKLLSVTTDKTARLFLASSEQPTKINQISGSGSEGLEGLRWIGDKSIVYSSMESENLDLWMIDADGKNPRQVTFDKASDEQPSISKDGKIVFISSRTGAPHIWKLNNVGGDAQQLTSKGGESFPQITPDGQTVIFTSFGNVSKVLWKMSANGGEPSILTKSDATWVLTHWAAISPDGKTVACLSKEGDIKTPLKLSLFIIEDGTFLKSFAVDGKIALPDITPVLRWTPDGKSVSYILTADGVSNIWTQSVTGGDAKKITEFSSERIFSFDWSADGKQIIYSRGEVRNNIVLFENF
ncbi:hypothetical protein BH10ACI1_BH10ACI1_20490 [soil metagenome]